MLLVLESESVFSSAARCRIPVLQFCLLALSLLPVERVGIMELKSTLRGHNSATSWRDKSVNCDLEPSKVVTHTVGTETVARQNLFCLLVTVIAFYCYPSFLMLTLSIGVTPAIR